jgi:protein-tyrosine phosphatase
MNLNAPGRRARRTLAHAMALAGLVAAGPARAGNPLVRDTLGPAAVGDVRIENFGVAGWRVFRGAQPTEADLADLKRIGVTLDIDLRDGRRGEERNACARLGIRYLNIPLDAKKKPTDADVERFLEAASDELARGGAVFVHCAGGRHRTGGMMAVFRMVNDGWSAEDAFREMEAYDYYSGRGHGGPKEYVFEFEARRASDPRSVPGGRR